VSEWGVERRGGAHRGGRDRGKQDGAEEGARVGGGVEGVAVGEWVGKEEGGVVGFGVAVSVALASQIPMRLRLPSTEIQTAAETLAQIFEVTLDGSPVFQFVNVARGESGWSHLQTLSTPFLNPIENSTPLKTRVR
jgi:hypothetical protein